MVIAFSFVYAVFLVLTLIFSILISGGVKAVLAIPPPPKLVKQSKQLKGVKGISSPPLPKSDKIKVDNTKNKVSKSSLVSNKGKNTKVGKSKNDNIMSSKDKLNIPKPIESMPPLPPPPKIEELENKKPTNSFFGFFSNKSKMDDLERQLQDKLDEAKNDIRIQELRGSRRETIAKKIKDRERELKMIEKKASLKPEEAIMPSLPKPMQIKSEPVKALVSIPIPKAIPKILESKEKNKVAMPVPEIPPMPKLDKEKKKSIFAGLRNTFFPQIAKPKQEMPLPEISDEKIKPAKEIKDEKILEKKPDAKSKDILSKNKDITDNLAKQNIDEEIEQEIGKGISIDIEQKSKEKGSKKELSKGIDSKKQNEQLKEKLSELKNKISDSKPEVNSKNISDKEVSDKSIPDNNVPEKNNDILFKLFKNLKKSSSVSEKQNEILPPPPMPDILATDKTDKKSKADEEEKEEKNDNTLNLEIKKKDEKKKIPVIDDVKNTLSSVMDQHLEIERQKKELYGKLGKIRGGEARKKEGLEKASRVKEDRKWLIEERQKELDDFNKRKELESKDEETERLKLQKILAENKEREEKFKIYLNENKKRIQVEHLKRHHIIHIERDKYVERENQKRLKQLEIEGRLAETENEDASKAAADYIQDKNRSILDVLIKKKPAKENADNLDKDADEKIVSVPVPPIFSKEDKDAFNKKEELLPMPPIPLAAQLKSPQDKEKKGFFSFFKAKDKKLEDAISAEKPNYVDEKMAAIYKALEQEERAEIARHERGIKLEENIEKKEKAMLDKEEEILPTFISLSEMPQEEREQIKKELAGLKRDREEIAKWIEEEKEKMSAERLEAEKEIQEAIQRIKQDNLMFVPAKEVLKKEHLIPDDALSPQVDKVFEMIHMARMELMSANVFRAQQIYVQIMQIYMQLSPVDKREVYDDISELYEERKRAEMIFVKH